MTMNRRTSTILAVLAIAAIIGWTAKLNEFNDGDNTSTEARRKITDPVPLAQWERDAWGRMTCDSCKRPIDPDNPKDGMYPDRRVLCAKCGERAFPRKRR